MGGHASCLGRAPGARPPLAASFWDVRLAADKEPRRVGLGWELPALEAQASKLRATIARRKQIAGASSQDDDVTAIVRHYEQVLLDVELMIWELLPAPRAGGAAQERQSSLSKTGLQVEHAEATVNECSSGEGALDLPAEGADAAAEQSSSGESLPELQAERSDATADRCSSVESRPAVSAERADAVADQCSSDNSQPEMLAKRVGWSCRSRSRANTEI